MKIDIIFVFQGILKTFLAYNKNNSRRKTNHATDLSLTLELVEDY